MLQIHAVCALKVCVEVGRECQVRKGGGNICFWCGKIKGAFFGQDDLSMGFCQCTKEL